MVPSASSSCVFSCTPHPSSPGLNPIHTYDYCICLFIPLNTQLWAWRPPCVDIFLYHKLGEDIFNCRLVAANGDSQLIKVWLNWDLWSVVTGIGERNSKLQTKKKTSNNKCLLSIKDDKMIKKKVHRYKLTHFQLSVYKINTAGRWQTPNTMENGWIKIFCN